MFTANTVKELIGIAQQFRYHHVHKEQALNILATLKRNGKALSTAQKKCCDDYARDVLGDRKYAPWLYVYTVVSGKFKEGWIPDNFYGAIIVQKLKGNYGEVSGLKPLNKLLLDSSLFPDLISYANGIYFTGADGVVQPSEVKGILFRDTKRVVFKLDRSMQGNGIYFFDEQTFNLDVIKSLGNGLFQTFIDQSPHLSRFHSGAVSTLRMTTVVNDAGQTSLRACYLRLGSGDDTHIKSSSHIRVPIDLNTGDFHSIAYLSDWTEIEQHPHTGARFEGAKFPNFKNCKDAVLKLHERVPFVRCIGWDLTVGREDDVHVLEWNGAHNDIKFGEATQGPCFDGLDWESQRS